MGGLNMVIAGTTSSLIPFRTYTFSSPSQRGSSLLNLSHKWQQSAAMDVRVLKSSLRKTNLWPLLDSCKQYIHRPSIAENFTPVGRWKDVMDHESSRGRRMTCRALLEGSDNSDYALDSESDKIQSALDGQKSIPGHIATPNSSNAVFQSSEIGESNGRTGVASFYSNAQLGSSKPKVEPPIQPNDAWVSVLWLIGPAVLVSSVVLPPFFLRKIFEIVLEDSLVTDFLILFFTETLFYTGVFVFLMIAQKVQQATGVLTWNSGTRSSLGYKLSQYATMALAVMLPLGAFAIVWPWTGPAAAAALLPYIAGLAVQYGFEQVVQEKKWSVWPLIPIIFQVYRLHQLNRATQLVAGLLYSLRGAEATAESLAVNGSLQTLVTVLQLLGMLCLWALAAYLTHAFSSEAQDWQHASSVS